MKNCPSCGASDNNGYINAEGVRMRACGRCMIQWRDEAISVRCPHHGPGWYSECDICNSNTGAGRK